MLSRMVADVCGEYLETFSLHLRMAIRFNPETTLVDLQSVTGYTSSLSLQPVHAGGLTGSTVEHTLYVHHGGRC